MSVSISLLARNDAGDAIVDLIDGGTTQPNGYMQFRTGAKPASPQVAATGVLLATVGFSNPAFTTFSNGQATANPIASDTSIAATGVAGWFRISDREGVPVFDGDVTITGGGGDVEFDNVQFIQGGTVAIDSFTVTMPQ